MNPSAQAALQALDELFRENEIAMSDRNGLLHDALRQFIEGAELDRVDAERYRWLREQIRTQGGLIEAQAMLWNCAPQRSRLDVAVDKAKDQAVYENIAAGYWSDSKGKT